MYEMGNGDTKILGHVHVVVVAVQRKAMLKTAKWKYHGCFGDITHEQITHSFTHFTDGFCSVKNTTFLQKPKQPYLI